MGSVRKKPEDDAPTDYFRQQKFILRLVGIPVETDLPISYWATKLPIILAIWLYTAVLHQISLVFVFKDFNDPDELLNNLLYESAFVTGIEMSRRSRYLRQTTLMIKKNWTFF